MDERRHDTFELMSKKQNFRNGSAKAEQANGGNDLLIHLNSCKKVFISRDYTKGLGVQFESTFPADLVGLIKNRFQITEDEWDQTINNINRKFAEAEKVSCGSVLETLTGCATCYLSRAFLRTQYQKKIDEIKQLIDEENRRLFHNCGLHLTEPMQRGLRVIEISILSTATITSEPLPNSNQQEHRV